MTDTIADEEWSDYFYYDVTADSDNFSQETELVNKTRSFGDAVVVPMTWSIMLAVGLVGNGLVLYVMVRHAERQTTNCFIANLALSDLIFLAVVIPMTMMHYIFHTWPMGAFMCRFNYYMTYVSIQAACLTLTAMTIDRYFAIVRPTSFISYRTPRNANITCIGIWIVSLLISVPFAIFTGIEPSNTGEEMYCRETWPDNYRRLPIVYVVTVSYVLPLAVISASYALVIRHLVRTHVTSISARAAVQPRTPSSGVAQQRHSYSWGDRKRKRAVTMVGVVVGMFAVTWLPIHIFYLWNRFDDNFPYTEGTYIYKIVAHTLSYANCCINPFIYGCLADGFRKGCRKVFSCCLAAPRRRVSLNMLSVTTRRSETCALNQTLIDVSSKNVLK